MSMREQVLKRIEDSKKTNRGGGKFAVGKEVEFFTPKAGTAELDFLPYRVTVDNHSHAKNGELAFSLKFLMHRGIGVDENSNFICPRTVGKPCPICEYVGKLNKDRNANKDLIQELKAKEREVFNVVDLNQENKGVQLFEVSTYNFSEKLYEEIACCGDDSVMDFANLTGGKTVTIRFREKKMEAMKFTECSRIDFTDREDYDESALELTHNLDTILIIPTYEDLKKSFLEAAEGTEEGTEAEGEDPKAQGRKLLRRTAGAAPKKLAPAAAKPKAQAEPEPTPEPEPEPEPQPEPAPKKKVLAGKKPQADADPSAQTPAAAKPLRKAQTQAQACPGSGDFGTDFETLDTCVSCESWTDCSKAHAGK